MTNDKRPPRIFFIHVMKTGGTALDRQLAHLYADGRTYPGTGRSSFVEKSDVDRLLSLEERDLADVDYFSPHIPAWVAFRVAPSHARITVLRDPVERTVSHLRQIAGYDVMPDDLEQIYGIDEWRLRLSNYQTRFVGFSETDHLAQKERAIVEAPSVEDIRPENTELAASLATGVRFGTPLEDAHLAAARERLAAIDIVGVTDRLDLVGATVARRFDVRVGELNRVNASRIQLSASDALAQRIRDDNQLDTELYDFANELVDKQEDMR